MDFSVVTAAMSSISAAKTMGETLIGVRDFNQTAGIVSELNGELLKAQESLFTLSAQLLEMQQKEARTAQELRDLQESMAERARYSMHQLSQGVFVYRSNGVTAEGNGDPVHYLCQPCFDKGTKAVLVYSRVTGHHRCPVCRTDY